MIGWKDTAFGVAGASLTTGSGPSSTGNLGSRPTDCGGPVNVPEEGVSWRVFLWLCLTFHRLSSSPVPRSRAVLPALSLPLSFTLCPSVSLCTQVSTSLALGQKPSVINGQPENRIRGHRARAQVNQRGGGGGGKGWPDDLCGRDLRWANG
jgi:hypothetical protein